MPRHQIRTGLLLGLQVVDDLCLVITQDLCLMTTCHIYDILGVGLQGVSWQRRGFTGCGAVSCPGLGRPLAVMGGLLGGQSAGRYGLKLFGG